MSTLVVLPEGADRAETLINDDGSIVVRWFEPCCDDDSHADFWSVTVSANTRTIDVELVHGREYDPYRSNVFETLRNVLRYQSGVNVNLTMTAAD